MLGLAERVAVRHRVLEAIRLSRPMRRRDSAQRITFHKIQSLDLNGDWMTFGINNRLVSN